MRKSELIRQLESIEGNPEVFIFDYLGSINNDDGETSSSYIYPVEYVEALNDDLTDDQKIDAYQEFGFVPDIIISLGFKNPLEELLEP